jgi:hypothetical protein
MYLWRDDDPIQEPVRCGTDKASFCPKALHCSTQQWHIIFLGRGEFRSQFCISTQQSVRYLCSLWIQVFKLTEQVWRMAQKKELHSMWMLCNMASTVDYTTIRQARYVEGIAKSLSLDIPTVREDLWSLKEIRTVTFRYWEALVTVAATKGLYFPGTLRTACFDCLQTFRDSLLVPSLWVKHFFGLSILEGRKHRLSRKVGNHLPTYSV